MSERWGVKAVKTGEIFVMESEQEAFDYADSWKVSYYVVVDRGEGWKSPWYDIDMG